MMVEEYTSKFYSMSIGVGYEQVTSCYLAGLNQYIRDEMGLFICLVLKMPATCFVSRKLNMEIWCKEALRQKI